MQPDLSRLASIFADPLAFTAQASGLQLRPYQAAPFPRILDSIRHHYGDTIILVFPRQSGKDEFLLHLQAYLLTLYASQPVGIVVVNPTYHPQTSRALQRFDHLLDRNHLTRRRWRKHGQFVRLIDQARISFLSGDSKSNVVGDTASLLLIVNEAQDILPAHYYRKFVPMTASTNATRLLAGTIWTHDSLLSTEIRQARLAEQQDGRQRLFMVAAGQVSQSVPHYALHVQQAIAAHGRQHPFVKSQYFNEEIDSQSGMFNAARLALLQPALPAPSTGQLPASPPPEAVIAFLLDVAGQDESAFSASSSLLLDHDQPLSNPGRDSVALSIVNIDLSTLQTLQAPTYRILHRLSWTGLNHLTILGQLKALAETWHPGHIVIDATGVGEGLWALLDKAFRHKVIPVKYTASLKSDIGYRFLSIIETGRFRDDAPDPRVEAQYRACQYEVLPGPAKTLRWGVPEGRRDSSGQLIHDDHLMADSLVTLLDQLDWQISSPALIIQSPDYLKEMDRNY